MDTKGWDVIYMASTQKCNSILAKNMSGLISSFDYKSGEIELSGTFGQWKIVNGGSDKIVHFQIPILSGNLSVNGVETNLAGVTPIIAIKLDFVDDPKNVGHKNLTFVAGGQGNSTASPNVFTVAVDARGDEATITPQNNPVAWGIMNPHLPLVFSENQDQLSYVFAQINLVPPENDSWLTPREMDFAYLDANEGFFVIFTSLSVKNVSTLPKTPDTSTMDTSDDFYICVSEKVLLEKMIMPGLPAAFGHGTNASSFKYQSVTDIPGRMEIGRIVNQGALETNTAKWALTTYYPKIKSLSISIANNQLQVSTSGDFDITGLAGASCSFSVNLHNTFSFDPNSGTFSFEKDPHPSTSYQKHIPWYDWALVAPFLLGLVALILDLVTNSVTSSVTDSVSNSENARVSTALKNTVIWAGYDDLRLTSAQLAQALTLKSNQ